MKTKICTNKKCLKEKPLSEFGKDKNKKDGLCSHCKECIKIYLQQWKKNNIEKIKQYRKIHKDKSNKRIKDLYKKYPWKRIFRDIKYRCNNLNSKDYYRYGGRGIKCLITEEEIKYLWFRDKAYEMDKPSIDRKDNNGNYDLSNCRFIEMNINSAKDKRKIILQFTKNNKFIKEWRCARDIEEKIGLNHSDIAKCAKGKLKTCGNFIWRYKND